MGVEQFRKQRETVRHVVSYNGKKLALPACWDQVSWEKLPQKKKLFIFRACTDFSFYFLHVFFPHISEAEGEECPKKLPPHIALFCREMQARVPDELLPFDHKCDESLQWKVCWVWSTGAFKSSCALAFESWLMGVNPSITIVKATSVATLGERFVSFHEENIRHNRAYRFVFGDLDRKSTRAGRVWRGDVIEVDRPLSRSAPSYAAVGYGGSFEGTRFDIAILDDIVDFQNSKTEESRSQQAQWVSQVLEKRLHPRRRMMLVIGTIHHRTDLYHRCAEESKTIGTWDFKAFKMIPQSAIDAGLWPPKKKNPALPYSLDNVIIPQNLPVLWDFWTPEVLVADYISNRTTFARTRQNEIDDPDEAMFTPTHLEFCFADGGVAPDGSPKPNLPFWNYVDGVPQPGSPIHKMYERAGIDIEYMVICCDLAATEKKPGIDPDWTVLQCWGWCRNTRRRVLLDMMRFRTGNPKTVKTKLLEFVRGYLPLVRKVAAEANAVDKLFVGELSSYLREELDTPVSVMSLRGEKAELISSFKDLITDPGVWIPYSPSSQRTRALVNVFKQELLDYPNGKHDDTLITAVHHIRLLKAGTMGNGGNAYIMGDGAEDEVAEADLGGDADQPQWNHVLREIERSKQRGVGSAWPRQQALSMSNFR